MGSKNEIEDLNKQLKDYQTKGYNIPGTTVLRETSADFLRPTIRLVTLNPNIKEGDIYEVSGGKCAFGRPAIQKFADAGRIELSIPQNGTRIERGPKLERCIARVVGERYDLDGALKRIEDEKSLDLIAIAESLYNKNMGKVSRNHPKWSLAQKEEFVESYVSEVMVDKRKFAPEMAITGAQARVVTKLLGLKPAYTREELTKPFVIISVELVVDMKDPATRQMVTAHMLGIREAIFPQSVQSAYVSPPAESIREVEVIKDPALVTASVSPLPVRPANADDNFLDYPRAMREAIVRRLPGAQSFEKDIHNLPDTELSSLYGSLKKAA
jgi:hypothetical protein